MSEDLVAGPAAVPTAAIVLSGPIALVNLTTPDWNASLGTPQAVSFSFGNDGSGLIGNGGWAHFSPEMEAATRLALADWRAVSGLQFIEVPDTPGGAGVDIRFRLENLGAGVAGETAYPRDGTVAIAASDAGRSFAPGGYEFLVLLHEIGHAIGLKHPFSGTYTLPASQDDWHQTVMSYNQPGAIPTNLGPLDAQAAAYLYGTRAAGDAFPIHWAWDGAANTIHTFGGPGDDAIRALDYPSAIVEGGGGNDTITGGTGANERLLGGDGNDSITAGYGGHALLTGDEGNDTLRGNGTGDRLFGGNGNDALVAGGSAGVELHGGAGNDVLTGGGSNDLLYGDDGDDIINAGFSPGAGLFGGAGNDTLSGSGPNMLFEGGSGANTITATGTHATLVIEAPRTLTTLVNNVSSRINGFIFSGTASAPGEADRFTGITDFVFLDGHLSYYPSGADAEALRLYQAALGRAPDVSGLHFWAGVIAVGSTAGAAAGFASSPEYAARYGAPDDAGFIGQLYANALGRPADAAGTAYWTGQLAAGQSRAAVLTSFSDSAENTQRTAGQVASGIWDYDEHAAATLRLYEATLARGPDASGLGYWKAQLDAGTPLKTVAGNFTGSAEFTAHYGAPDDTAFVATLYANVLGRAPDAGGLAYYVGGLGAHTIDRTDVVVGFSESAEFVAHTAPLLQNGIAFA